MAQAQICRVIKDTNFTVMGNYHLRDENLSLKAKGLLSIVLSLPPDWDYSVAGLVAIVKEKETTIRSCLNELKKAGYLEVKKEVPNKENGGHFKYIYIFYEKNQLLDHKTGNSICDFLDIESLDVEVLDVENQRQLNTNILSKEKINKEEKNISLKEESTKDNLRQEFETLWQLYPRKEGKADGLKHYIKARKKGISMETILSGLEKYKSKVEQEHTERKYIIKGGNWFKGERWEDEVYIESKQSKSLKNLDFS